MMKSSSLRVFVIAIGSGLTGTRQLALKKARATYSKVARESYWRLG